MATRFREVYQCNTLMSQFGENTSHVNLPSKLLTTAEQMKWLDGGKLHTYQVSKLGSSKKLIVVGECSNSNGKVGLPKWMRDYLDIVEGEQILVERYGQTLKNPLNVKLQAHNYKFQKLVMDQKLEPLSHCLRKYLVLTKDTTITVEYKNVQFKINVTDTDPEDTVTLLGFGDKVTSFEWGEALDAKQNKFKIDNPELARRADLSNLIFDDDDEPIWQDDNDEKKDEGQADNPDQTEGQGVQVDIFEAEDEPTLIERDQQGEEVKRFGVCSVCGEMKHIRQLERHEMSCGIGAYRCPEPKCLQRVLNSEKEDHEKTEHKQVKCECGLYLMQCELAYHQARHCLCRRGCHYCARRFLPNLFEAHVEECANTQIHCPRCQRNDVTRRDFKSGAHNADCQQTCECGSRITEATKATHRRSCRIWRRTNCRACGLSIRVSEADAHRDVCPGAAAGGGTGGGGPGGSGGATGPAWDCQICPTKNNNGAACRGCTMPRGSR